MLLFDLELYRPVNIVKVMSSWSFNLLVPFLGGICPLNSKPVLVHIFLPVTDNYLSWISGRGRMTAEMRWSISVKVMWPAGTQAWDSWICSQTYLPTALWSTALLEPCHNICKDDILVSSTVLNFNPKVLILFIFSTKTNCVGTQWGA